MAVSLNDADFQKYFDVPDFNQQYTFGLGYFNISDNFNQEEFDDYIKNHDSNKICDYWDNMSAKERVQSIKDLGFDEDDYEDQYEWTENREYDEEFICEDVMPALAECIHNNTLPAIWKGLIPKLTKAYYAPDSSQYNCNVTESDFNELKRCWEKVPAVIDEMIQYIKDNNITYENWNDVADSLINSGHAKLSAISSSDIWGHYVSTVSNNLGYYIRNYLRNNG